MRQWIVEQLGEDAASMAKPAKVRLRLDCGGTIGVALHDENLIFRTDWRSDTERLRH
ncbi:hypothetical protein C8K44_105255 [Aminobacter sp. AP02]|nr:hypothetical protein C8K44_105255 [Aminobacter sp. AP02]